MPDDLLTVLLCELGERILAMREVLAAPAVMSKPHTLALSHLLAADLGAIGSRLQRDVITARCEDRSRGTDDALGDALYALADCAAAPSLFYADWTHPIGDAWGHVRAYRDRLMARPSFARAIEEARPYRSYFPLGAPDRD